LEIPEKSKSTVEFRYRNARVKSISQETVTFIITDIRDRKEEKWCFYDDTQRKTLLKAIRADIPLNILISRLLVEVSKDHKKTEDWLTLVKFRKTI